MAQWMVWSFLAASLVILELFSGTFYLLMIAIGLVAGALVAFAGGTLEIQLIVAAVVGLLATSILRRSRFGRAAKRGVAGNPDMNLDIGQVLLVDRWAPQVTVGAPYTARVMYRGAMWDVELADGASVESAASMARTASAENPAMLADAPVPGRYLIRQIQGSRLIVGSMQ